MILFRLFDFFVRVFVSFLFVFILQVHFDGKSLESYLTKWSEGFFLTKALNSVSDDGVKITRSFTLNDKQKKKKRELANKKAVEIFENLSKRLSLPKQEDPKEN